MTNQPKRKKTNTSSPIDDSIGRGMLSNIEQELGLDKLFEGEMTHLSFDIPKKLRTELVAEAKSNGDSVCKILVKAGASYLVTSRIKKHAIGNTLSRSLEAAFTIQNLNFEQQTQARPRRYMRQVEPKPVGEEGRPTCEIGRGDCTNVAIGEGVYKKTGKKYRLCRMHMNVYANCTNDWALIN